MTARRHQLFQIPRAIAWVVAVFALALAAAASLAAAQAAPDAFYLSLLRDGKAEMLRGDAVGAKKSFRLACFGFLEQPVLLAEGLVRLGLAEAALNDQEAFVATFSRLAEVEERFAAYAPAALSADERRAFEDRALEWATPEVLRSLPSFAPLLARKSEVDFARLAPRERTRELEKRSAAEPGNARWKVLLAQDEAAGDHMARVLARLEGVPDAAENGAAGCLRGRALADLERCEAAVVALAACATVTSDALLAEAQVHCLVALERFDAARAFAAGIVRPAAEAAAVRKAIARIPEPPAAPAAKVQAPAKAAKVEVPAKEKGPVKEKGRPAVDPVPAPAPKAQKEPVKSGPAAAKPVVEEPKGPVKGEAAPASVAKTAPPRPAAVQAVPAAEAAPISAPAGPKPGAGALTADEERVVADARGMLKAVEDRDELRRGFTLLQPVADRLPGRSDLQLLAGEIAYRAGLWTAGGAYFKRSTPSGTGPVDPTLRFYYAVCLYEAGDFAGAAQAASTGLEKLQRLPFVDGYLAKIRAAHP